MMDSTQVTMDTVNVSMPFSALAKCEGKSMYPEMTIILKEIYENLASIKPPFGQGRAGFLGIMKHATFNTLMGPLNLQKMWMDTPTISHPMCLLVTEMSF